MTDPAPSLSYLALLLHDLAVERHSMGDLDVAEHIYGDALRAMQDSMDLKNVKVAAHLEDEVTSEWGMKYRFLKQVVSDCPPCASRDTVRYTSYSAMHGVQPIRTDMRMDSRDKDLLLCAVMLHNVGILHHIRGNLQKAKTLLHMALEMISRDSRGTAIASTHYILACIYAEEGRGEESIAQLESALCVEMSTSDGSNSPRRLILERLGHLLASDDDRTRDVDVSHMPQIGNNQRYGSQPRTLFSDQEDAAPAA